jgi:hypothetical protein
MRSRKRRSSASPSQQDLFSSAHLSADVSAPQPQSAQVPGIAVESSLSDPPGDSLQINRTLSSSPKRVIQRAVHQESGRCTAIALAAALGLLQSLDERTHTVCGDRKADSGSGQHCPPAARGAGASLAHRAEQADRSTFNNASGATQTILSPVEGEK